jgi:hypothetical protein
MSRRSSGEAQFIKESRPAKPTSYGKDRDTDAATSAICGEQAQCWRSRCSRPCSNRQLISPHACDGKAQTRLIVETLAVFQLAMFWLNAECPNICEQAAG